MSESNSEGVHGVGVRCFGQPENRTYHETDLRLLGASPANHCQFHALRRILVNGQPNLGGSQNRRTARGAEGNCRARVLGIDNTLHRADLGLMKADQIAYLLVNLNQTLGHREFGAVADHPISHRPNHPPVLFQNSIAGVSQRRVKGKQKHRPAEYTRNQKGSSRQDAWLWVSGTRSQSSDRLWPMHRDFIGPTINPDPEWWVGQRRLRGEEG